MAGSLTIFIGMTTAIITIEMIKYTKHTILTLAALTSLHLLAPAKSLAVGSVVVTFAENASAETSSLAGTSLYDFNGLSTGRNTNVNWAGVGTFDQLYIKNPDAYGGATDATHPNGSKYSVQGVGTSVSQTTLTLSQNSGYFGLWWSAGDRANVMSFYNNSSLVAQFTTASLLGNLSSSYYGNPRNRGLNSGEPYAFINFFGDANTTWNKVVLTNATSSGFESDNYTSRVTTYNSQTDGSAAIGTAVARVSGTTTTAVASNATGAALWGSAGGVPGAPVPALGWVAAFGVCLALKGRKAAKGREADSSTRE